MALRQEQHYPTYDFDDQRVVELELQQAQRDASAQSRLYSQLVSLLLGGATLLFSLIAALAGRGALPAGRGPFLVLAICGFFLLSLLLAYFADLRKTAVLSERKVVVLRTMLGLDYGPVQGVLPIDRVDGAVNPFVLRLFGGWWSFNALPFWTIYFLALAIWLAAAALVPTSAISHRGGEKWTGVAGALILGLWYSVGYRRCLLEAHETFLLLATRGLARMMRVTLKENVEYVVYRARLAAIEVERLGLSTETLRSIAVSVEDGRFAKHPGVDVRAMVRAAASRFTAVRARRGLIASGASTISMQTVRGLLIVDYSKTIRRKLLEVPLALWLESQFSKEEILNLYLASARYARGVYGLAAAVRHYFPGHQGPLEPAQAFVLIERLSSVEASYRRKRIVSLLDRVDVPHEIRQADLSESAVFGAYAASPAVWLVSEDG